MRGRPVKNLAGLRFGMLTVIHEAGKKNGLITWYCRCDCGNDRTVAGRYLRERKTTSCGCSEKTNKHGGSNSRLYRIWRGMKRRCNNPKCKDYSLYGAKGVTVCKEWNGSFAEFRTWAVENGYTDELSIDRIDCAGNYEPNNCRWVNNVVQGNNRSTNVYVEINGERHTLAEWSRITGIKRYTIRDRYRAGKTGKDLIKQG